MSKESKKTNIYNNKKHTTIATIVSVLSVIFGLLTLAVIIWVITGWQPNHAQYDFKMKALLACTTFWAIIPPIWFWSEFFFLFVPKYNKQRDHLEAFKLGQDNAKAIWAAFVLVTAGLTTALASSVNGELDSKGSSSSQITELQSVP